jgi:hypothetical protein
MTWFINFLPLAGPINQFSNTCFFLSALVCDVLLIRCCLVGAFVSLFVGRLNPAALPPVAPRHALCTGLRVEGVASQL